MKIEGWEKALEDYLKVEQENDFEWGLFDCCSFAGGAVEAMTGVNPYLDFMAEIGHAYHDEKTGRAFMERKGGLARILTREFGHHVNDGVEGDLAYCVFPDGSAVGVLMGSHCIFRGETGLVAVDPIECRFFKVR